MASKKTCPKCAEKILAAAKRCKHCGYEYGPRELKAQRDAEVATMRRGSIGCIVILIAGSLIFTVARCSSSSDSPAGTAVANLAAAASPQFIETSRAASQPSLRVSPRVLDAHRVEFTITTNIPLPIKVATSINLEGQKDSDTYIGYQGPFLTISQPTTKVVLDTGKADQPLPAANYVASVDFFPSWGAEGNPAAAKLPEVHAAQIFKLGGRRQSRASAVLERTRQKWVMENVSPDDPWDRSKFEKELGVAEKAPSTLSPVHDAYYFPGADMTLIVNRITKTVSVWRMGRATK